MPTTSTDRPVGTTGLVWCLRAFAWLPLLTTLGLAAASLLLFAQPGGYEARALVVTRQLEPNARVLPRYAAAVFASGEVARRVAAQLGVDRSTVVPARIEAVTPEDSIVMTVVGKDADPAMAARLADLGAAAFVAELNRGGPGVGTFSVQTRAAVPGEPVAGFPAALTAASGGLAGAVLGLGVIVLITVVRRPVVAAEDVRQVVGTELVGELRLPGRAGRYAHPRDVPGVVAVARRMGGIPSGRFLVVSDPRNAALREHTVVTLGVALGGLRPTIVRGEPHLAEGVRTVAGGPLRPRLRSPIVLVDQTEPLDMIDETTELPMLVVIVAPRGEPATRLRAAAADHLRPEMLGVVLTEPVRRLPRWTGRKRGRSGSAHATVPA